MTPKEAVESLKAQFLRKNADYGDSAHQSFVRFGPIAYAVRLSDKFNRWGSLRANDAQVNEESLADTIGDAFTYLCMWAAEYTDGNTEAVSAAMDDAMNCQVRDCPNNYEAALWRFNKLASCFGASEADNKTDIKVNISDIIVTARIVLNCLCEFAHFNDPDLTRIGIKPCDLIQHIERCHSNTFAAYNNDLGSKREVNLIDELLFVEDVYKDTLYAWDFGGEEYEIPASRIDEFRRVKVVPVEE